MTLWDRLKTLFTSQSSAVISKNSNAASGSERGLVRKKQRMMDGFISSDGMLAPRACTIWDMSPLGGKVELWNNDIKSSVLGDSVKLYVTGDRKEVDCKVMWRKDNSMGLKFTSGFHAPTRRYG
jgi:hypothetical protein